LQADAGTTQPAQATPNQEWNPENVKFVSDVTKEGVVLYAIALAVLAAFLVFFLIRCVCCTFMGNVRVLSSHSPSLISFVAQIAGYCSLRGSPLLVTRIALLFMVDSRF
jgi:hypothetical protein